MRSLISSLLRFKTAAYEGYELNSAPLTRGKGLAQAIGIAGIFTIDVLSGGDSELTVSVRMTGAANGDLAVRVGVFLADGTTISNIGLTPIRSTGPTFGAGVVEYTATYDVGGIDKARIFISNLNAGAQTIQDWSWRLT